MLNLFRKTVFSFLLVGLILGGRNAFAQQNFETFAQEFQKWKTNQTEEFNNYVKQLNKEFKQYLKIYREEFRKYKEKILKEWDKAEVSDRHKFVFYKDGFKTKEIINYEKGYIEISTITEASPEKAKLKLKKELVSLLLMKKNEAFQKDTLLRNVEKRVTKLKFVKTGKIEPEPMISDIILNKKLPSKQEVMKFVNKAMKKNKIVVKKTKKGKRVYTIKIPFPKDLVVKKAKKYKPYVRDYTRRYKIEPALVYAIIHTESSYNPLAQSPIPAYGLMQIVPQTAGKDASRIVYGRPVLLAPSYLFNSKNNIQIGTAYVYLLYYNYLKGIKNPKVRMYCAISAYNGGIGRVFKVLTGTTRIKKAIKKINQMSEEEIYRILITRMPEETKNYLRRVYARYKIYKKITEGGVL